MTRPVVIWGASGHALVVADALRQAGGHHVVGFLDDVVPERSGEPFGGATILGGREALPRLRAAGVEELIVAIGACAPRLAAADAARALGFRLATAVHPRATVAPDVTVGAGTLVCAGAVVTPAAAIGACVIVNTAATVDHECRLDDGVHVGPGAHLGGRVVVERGAWIGIGAVVRDRVRIGAAAVVGAGAVVVADVPPRTLVYGVPARPQRTLDDDG